MERIRVLLGLVIFSAIMIWATRPEGGSQESRSGADSSDSAQSRSSSVTVSASSPTRALPDRDALWAKFRERYGHELEPKFNQDGRLISVRGRPGRSKRLEGFSSEDPRKAIARAREILEGASDLLGVTPDWPLGQPIAKVSGSSAQVFFQESQSGVEVAPFGSISVDLDSQGGLLGLDSSYVSAPTVVNSERLSTADAKLRALAAVPEAEGKASIKVEGGDPILWVSRDRSGAPQARHAFEYYVQGRKIVVDASNGAILHKRDVRQF